MDSEDDVSIHERGLEDTNTSERTKLFAARVRTVSEGKTAARERERQLLRREREMTHSLSTTSSVASTIGSVRNIKDLLSEFDATDNTFWR